MIPLHAGSGTRAHPEKRQSRKAAKPPWNAQAAKPQSRHGTLKPQSRKAAKPPWNAQAAKPQSRHGTLKPQSRKAAKPPWNAQAAKPQSRQAATEAAKPQSRHGTLKPQSRKAAMAASSETHALSSAFIAAALPPPWNAQAAKPQSRKL